MKKLVSVLILIAFFALKASAQFTPDATFGQNPATSIIYTPSTISVPVGSTGTWSITNGTITSSPTVLSSVTVKWNDLYTASTGTLTISYTPPGGVLTTYPLTYNIKALKNFTPGPISGSPTQTLCNTATSLYAIPQVAYNFSPTTYADGYEWTIPTGWKYPDGSVSDGTTVHNLPTGTNGLYLKPDGCHGGTIKIRAYTLNGATYVSYSNMVQLIVSTTDGITVTGPATVVCGSTAPLTYSFTGGSCASAISWTLPTGWTGTSTTNTITVTPTAVNSGPQTITANVTMCGGVIHKPFVTTPALFDPAHPPLITGATTLCSGSTQTYSIAPATSGSIVWSVTGTGATILGANNGSTVTLQYVTRGNAVLTATVTSPCTDGSGNSNIPVPGFPICVGVPVNPSTTGTVSICTQGGIGNVVVTPDVCSTAYTAYSNTADFFPNHANPDYDASITSISDHRSFQYIIGASGTTKPLTTDLGVGTYHIYLFAINSCGYSTQSNVIITVKTCGGRGGAAFTVFPNPSSSTLNVAYTTDEATTGATTTEQTAVVANNLKSYYVELLNAKGAVVAKGWTNKTGKLSMDISKLAKATYYVHIHHENEVIKKQFIIN